MVAKRDRGRGRIYPKTLVVYFRARFVGFPFHPRVGGGGGVEPGVPSARSISSQKIGGHTKRWWMRLPSRQRASSSPQVSLTVGESLSKGLLTFLDVPVTLWTNSYLAQSMSHRFYSSILFSHYFIELEPFGSHSKWFFIFFRFLFSSSGVKKTIVVSQRGVGKVRESGGHAMYDPLWAATALDLLLLALNER